MKKAFWHKLLILTLFLATLSVRGTAQDISQIAKSDPLIISGAVGTRNSYYHSTGYSYTSPFQSSIWANLNISVYGISMPFSFYYTNNDLSFSYPQFNFRISPTYKNWRMFIGQGSLGFSSYVMNTSVKGFGLEYAGDRLRFGMFYGVMRSAVNDDPEDFEARHPQYKRMGWGFKVGYGSGNNYLDLYFLRAYDCPSSIDERWWSTVTPQSNLVVGVRGATRPLKWMTLTVNAATSAFTTDTRAPKVESGKVTRFDNIFEAKYTSSMRFAGDASMAVSLRGLNASLFYRIIQPDYNTLGSSYMSNNFHSLGVNLSTRLFRKLTLGGTFSAQADNLSNEQLYTTRGYVYSANAGTRLGKMSLSLRYSGYLQDQGDGSAKVTDSTRVHRIMHSISASVSRNWQTEQLSHTLGLSGSVSMNRDLNRYATGKSDVTTVSGGVNYCLLVEPWHTDFSATLNHQESRGYQRRYTSDILALTASRSFFENNPLTLSATLSTCYNKMRKMRENMSLGGDMQATYSLKKVHNFSLTAGISRSNDVNISSNEDMYNVTEFNVGMSYTYTFTLLEIKRSAEKKEKSQESGKTIKKEK